MGAKKTLVALTPIGGSAPEFFEIEHAERIMRLPNCAWRVTDEHLEWTSNGFTTKSNTSGVKAIKQKTANK